MNFSLWAASQARSPPTVIPSTPGLPRFAFTRFYGAGCQDAPSPHAVGSFFDRRRPHGLDCRFDDSGWGGVRSQGPHRSPEDVYSRRVLRSSAGTILLSGALWPIASFGSPGVHSLVVGAWDLCPGPWSEWMLSPVTGPLPVRRTPCCDRLRPHARRSRPDLLRRFQCFQSLGVVRFARAPHR